MVRVTGVLQQEAWDNKRLPPIERVRPRVWSVPVPVDPFPIRHTFSYIVTDGAGSCVVIDPGWDSDAGRELLVEGLRQAGQTLRTVVGIVVSHFHTDHLAMAKWLADETGAWLAMHHLEGEWLERYPNMADAQLETTAWLCRLGVPEDERSGLALHPDSVAEVHGFARPTLLVRDGDVLPFAEGSLRVLATPGHTQGHIAIVDAVQGLIFTGDHILPRITSNVGVTRFDDEADPLQKYLDSLEAVLPWSEFEVLPAHEYRFLGLRERVDALREHHVARLAEILSVVQRMGSATIWQIAEQISWSRGWGSLSGMNLRSALNETAAHLVYARNTGAARLHTRTSTGAVMAAPMNPRESDEDRP